ncbi:MAG TPA: SDR family oxidoreductase [Bacilli bacterium]|jgi:short-subunit dehydrogenase|nr:SDR family oxidoreductase [Bacilli bacterium]HQC83669.1 SDR family oxidoreductase [Bacilli bacterium]
MKALITGASSGIGMEMAKYLASKNIDLILVARREDRLKALQQELKVNVKIISLDISDVNNDYKLYEMTKNENIDILINNAGFGLFGEFKDTSLDRELEMIDLNIKAVHVLTKLYLNDFIKKDSGYILNVASSAGFLAGPKLSTYYATKNYVLKLSEAIYEELKMSKSNVHISSLCPGPVETEFNDVAHGSFVTKGVSPKYVAKCAIDGMFKKKMVIIPTMKMKLAIFFQRFISTSALLKYIYYYQSAKIDKTK